MRNPALETKAKALEASLLDERDYKALIEAENLSQVVSYLKEHTHYGDYLEEINPETASRVDIEAAFSRILLDNTEKLLYFVQGAENSFLRSIILKNNLTSFLIILRAIIKKENLDKIIPHLSFSKEFSKNYLDRIKNVEDFRTFKELTKGTSYYRAIETFDAIDSSDLFSLEKTMERVYYDELYKRLKKISSNDYKKLIKVMRMEIDLLNILWLYRAKRFYNLNADQIIPYIYRGGYYLNEEKLAKLAYITDFDDFLKALKSYKQYDFLFEDESEDFGLTLERKIRRFLYNKFKELSYFGKSISVAYSFLRLLEDEYSDIISIIEGKRYNLSAAEMQKYLIRSI